MSCAEARRRCPGLVFVRRTSPSTAVVGPRVDDGRGPRPASEPVGLDEGYLDLGEDDPIQPCARRAARGGGAGAAVRVAGRRHLQGGREDRVRPRQAGRHHDRPPRRGVAFLAPLPLRLLPGAGPAPHPARRGGPGDHRRPGRAPGRADRGPAARPGGHAPARPRPRHRSPPGDRRAAGADLGVHRAHLRPRRHRPAELSRRGEEMSLDVAGALGRRDRCARTVTVKLAVRGLQHRHPVGDAGPPPPTTRPSSGATRRTCSTARCATAPGRCACWASAPPAGAGPAAGALLGGQLRRASRTARCRWRRRGVLPPPRDAVVDERGEADGVVDPSCDELHAHHEPAPGKRIGDHRGGPAGDDREPGAHQGQGVRGSSRSRARLPRRWASASSTRRSPARRTALTGMAAGPSGSSVARIATRSRGKCGAGADGPRDPPYGACGRCGGGSARPGGRAARRPECNGRCRSSSFFTVSVWTPVCAGTKKPQRTPKCRSSGPVVRAPLCERRRCPT